MSALLAVPLGQRHAPAGLAHTVAGGTVLRVAADREIYTEGDAATFFYDVLSGVVRTCKFHPDGSRQIDAFYHTGEILGFEPGSHHRLTAEAVSDCALLRYRRPGTCSAVGGDAQSASQLLPHAMRCLARAQDHALVLGRRGAAPKLAAFLLEMAAVRVGGDAVALAMTRQDVADYLGLTIETVSRTLSRLERDGVIALPSARRIVLRDRGTLRSLNA